MALALTSIFRALPDGARRLEVVLEQRFAGTVVRVIGVEMSAFEQSVFFSILEMAGVGGEQVSARDAGIIPAPPRGMSARGNIAADSDAVEIRTTIAEILKRCGHVNVRAAGSETRRAAQVALQRLGGITVAVTDADGRGGFVSLLRAAWDGDSISIALNPRSAQALHALRGYAPIHMPTYRSLPTPTAKILYAWLRAWYAGAHGERSIGYAQIEAHVWGEATISRSARSKRRRLIWDAARAISEISDDLRCHPEKKLLRVTRVRASVDGDCSPAVDILQPSG